VTHITSAALCVMIGIDPLQIELFGGARTLSGNPRSRSGAGIRCRCAGRYASAAAPSRLRQLAQPAAGTTAGSVPRPAVCQGPRCPVWPASQTGPAPAARGDGTARQGREPSRRRPHLWRRPDNDRPAALPRGSETGVGRTRKTRQRQAKARRGQSQPGLAPGVFSDQFRKVVCSAGAATINR
jgi:hypothetical protein